MGGAGRAGGPPDVAIRSLQSGAITLWPRSWTLMALRITTCWEALGCWNETAVQWYLEDGNRFLAFNEIVLSPPSTVLSAFGYYICLPGRFSVIPSSGMPSGRLVVPGIYSVAFPGGIRCLVRCSFVLPSSSVPPNFGSFRHMYRSGPA